MRKAGMLRQAANTADLLRRALYSNPETSKVGGGWGNDEISPKERKRRKARRRMQKASRQRNRR